MEVEDEKATREVGGKQEGSFLFSKKVEESRGVEVSNVEGTREEKNW